MDDGWCGKCRTTHTESVCELVEECGRLDTENARLRKALGEIAAESRQQYEATELIGCGHDLERFAEIANAALSAGKGEG